MCCFKRFLPVVISSGAQRSRDDDPFLLSQLIYYTGLQFQQLGINNKKVDEFNEAFKKHPITWTIFIIYTIGWALPLTINVFFAKSMENLPHQKDHHSPIIGLLTLSVLYFLVNLTLGFIGEKNNVYLKFSGYIGISMILFTSIYNG